MNINNELNGRTAAEISEIAVRWGATPQTNRTVIVIAMEDDKDVEVSYFGNRGHLVSAMLGAMTSSSVISYMVTKAIKFAIKGYGECMNESKSSNNSAHDPD